MDATKRPMTIPPEIANYADQHGIFDLYKRLLAELVINKPDDPLNFIIDFLRKDDDDVPRVVVIGPPASGKASVSHMLSKSLGISHITKDGIMSGADVIEQVQHFTNVGQPLPPHVWAKMVHSRLSMYDAIKKGWVLDNVIETREQALALSVLGVYPKHCILLDAPDTVLIERASGKRVDPVTGNIYHVTFDWPSSIEIASRLEESPGSSDTEVAERLIIYHRNIDGIKSCYQHVLKTINADQPKADVFSHVMTFVCQQPRSAAPHTPRIILIGPRGSGRGTQAELLANKYRLVNVDCGRLISQAIASNSSTGHACKSYVDKGLAVPDVIVLNLLKDRLSQLDCVTRGWVLHRYPLTRDQAESLQGAGFLANRVFFLDISSEAILERLTLRATDPMTGNQYHLLYNPPRTQEVKDRLQTHPSDTVDAVTAELSKYQAYREELLDYYSNYGCQRVNVDQDTHTIFETLESMIVNPLPKGTKQ